MDKLLHRLYSYLKKKVRNHPLLSAISLVVLCAHLSVFIYSSFQPMQTINPHRKKLVVHTKVLPQEVIKIKPQEKLVQSTTQAVKAVATKSPSRETANQPSVKKPKANSVAKVEPARTKQPLSKPPEVRKTKKLLTELQESIAKIETNRDNVSPTSMISVPTPIKELKADSYEIQSGALTEESAGYKDVLIQHLKDALNLPGYGTVKIELTLSHEGIMQKLDVVYSDSEVNRLYLENALSQLSFPHFNGELVNKKSYKFCLTFCSD